MCNYGRGLLTSDEPPLLGPVSGLCAAGHTGGRRDDGEVLQRQPPQHPGQAHPTQRLHQVQDPQVSPL